jgi:hypothetical protein
LSSITLFFNILLMYIASLLAELKAYLTDMFALVDQWFDQPAALRAYRPADLG